MYSFIKFCSPILQTYLEHLPQNFGVLKLNEGYIIYEYLFLIIMNLLNFLMNS